MLHQLWAGFQRAIFIHGDIPGCRPTGLAVSCTRGANLTLLTTAGKHHLTIKFVQHPACVWRSGIRCSHCFLYLRGHWRQADGHRQRTGADPERRCGSMEENGESSCGCASFGVHRPVSAGSEVKSAKPYETAPIGLLQVDLGDN